MRLPTSSVKRNPAHNHILGQIVFFPDLNVSNLETYLHAYTEKLVIEKMWIMDQWILDIIIIHVEVWFNEFWMLKRKYFSDQTNAVKVCTRANHFTIHTSPQNISIHISPLTISSRPINYKEGYLVLLIFTFVWIPLMLYLPYPLSDRTWI